MMEKAKKPVVSLNHKIIIALFFVILFYAVLDSFLHHRLITPNFTALEERDARASITRCVSHLNEDLERLDRQNYEWSNWDETYDFVTIGNPDFVKRNLAGTYLTDTDLDFMYFHDATGRLVWGEFLDPMNSGRDVVVPEEINRALGFYISGKNGRKGIHGLLADRKTPILLSIKPILKSDGSGVQQGTVTIGRFLGEAALEKISNATLTKFSFIQLDSPDFPEDLKPLPNAISNENHYEFRRSRDTLSISTFFPDIYGKTAFLLSVSNNREIIARARDAEKSAFNSVMIIGLIILVSTFILLRVIVISPLNNLTRYIRQLQAEDYKIPVPINILHTDEIAVLAYEFDRLVNKLSESRKKLLVQSYYAGIGESSSLILHNIRNTLNPIVVNVDLLRLGLREISVDHLKQAVNEYTNPETNPERRKDIEEYLLLSADRISDFFNNIRKRLDQMIVQSGRIESLLASQKKFTHVKPPIEQIQVPEVVKDSIDRLDTAGFHNITIRIDPDLHQCGILEVERIYLMQVLEHLITNAAEAIEAGDAIDGRIEISGKPLDSDGQERILLMVIDNGIGIEREKISEIFRRGYTTKDKKSAGTGLHWCATTVSAMHGRIWVDSKGKNTGTCVYLELPRFRDLQS
ncbi:MAG: hypothetical protein KKG47_07745 [Proteobacteria bacterium]|nr:hypothetical protein [Pseudomonadota bacterium]MBU1739360.1 hypothetical protein [Pseudomonadota bacterium]